MKTRINRVFSSKAEKYDRYRWSYAREAIQTIFKTTRISTSSVVADLGAGTGVMTREFVGKVGQIYAVEPNPEMRAFAKKNLSRVPSCHVIEGHAEATSLPHRSIDLIIAAQAVHWFEPEPAKKEFDRILKPEGWLALCRNYGTDRELGKALEAVFPTETDTGNQMIGKTQPRSYYYSEGHFEKLAFPFSRQVNWDEFFGGLASASFAPDEHSSFYSDFKKKAKNVFEQFNTKGVINLHGITELYLGQIRA